MQSSNMSPDRLHLQFVPTKDANRQSQSVIVINGDGMHGYVVLG